MREIIQFSENHPAILVSEIVAIMPPVRVEMETTPEPWRVTFGMRGGSTVHVDIYHRQVPVDDSAKETIEADPVKYGLRPGAGRLEIAAAVQLRTVCDVADKFFKDSVETWRASEKSNN